jgi:hypothetical protein
LKGGKREMNQSKPLNKKGVLGLDTAKLFVLAILSLAIVAVVTLIVLDSLQDATTLTDAGEIINNTSAALGDFFADAGTWFTLIGVVIIILIISSVIIVINRFGSEQSTDFG